MNQHSLDVIGNRHEDPDKSEGREDEFAVKNVELLTGYRTFCGPLSGRNLVEHLAEKFKDHPEKWSQDNYDIGQYQVYRPQCFPEREDMWDAIKFLNAQREVASQTEKETVEEFTSEETPISRSALKWLTTSKDSSGISWQQTSEYPRKDVRLVTMYFLPVSQRGRSGPEGFRAGVGGYGPNPAKFSWDEIIKIGAALGE